MVTVLSAFTCSIIESLYTKLATKWQTYPLKVKSEIWRTTGSCTHHSVWPFHHPPTFHLTQLATPLASWVDDQLPQQHHSWPPLLRKKVWNGCWTGRLYPWLYSEFLSFAAMQVTEDPHHVSQLQGLQHKLLEALCLSIWLRSPGNGCCIWKQSAQRLWTLLIPFSFPKFKEIIILWKTRTVLR